MPRPKTNHEEKRSHIIEVATTVFARHGYAGTTNKLIAAEVQRHTGQTFSPALIYHYFPEGKQQLFGAVLQQYAPLQALHRTVQSYHEAEPEIFLQNVGRSYIEAFRHPVTAQLVRILFMEGPRQPELAEDIFSRIGPLLFLPVMNYWNRQVQLGRFRPVNSFVATLEFFGPLLLRAFLTDIFGQQRLPFPLPSDEEMLANHVQSFLQGIMLPTSTEPTEAN